ncbi:MAG: TolC family protein [Rubrivivax sp.]
MKMLRLPLLSVTVLALLSSWPGAASAQVKCVDESTPSAQTEAERSDTAALPPPRERLSAMVQTALERSHAVGASSLLVDAAQSDLAEARTALDPSINIEARLGPFGNKTGNTTVNNTVQAEGTISFTQLLYDAGRARRVIDWRQHLADAALHNQISAQEQVAALTVGLALEHSRFRQHVQVYGQYVRKMACLVEALETIVAADRGRASEWVQAQKSLEQAQLSQTQAQAQMRQVEVRLRKLVGENLPSTEGMSTAVLVVPDRDETLAAALDNPVLKQLSAQALAADRYAQSVEASSWPQVDFTAKGGGEHSLGEGAGANVRTKSGNAGLSIRIPLTTRGLAHATDAAQLRARAAFLQRDEALESQRARIVEVHDQALAAFDRARRVGAVLRNSEMLRTFTLQQWQQLGRRSLFDVMGTEAEHFNLRVQYVNALHDGQQLNVVMLSLGRGVGGWLR